MAIDDARVTEMVEREVIFCGMPAVQAALERIAARNLPESCDGIKQCLLADLKAFPASFARRLEQWIEFETSDEMRARLRVFELYAARERGTLPTWLGWAGGCSCECRGANGALARQLRHIRQAAGEVRATDPRRVQGRWARHHLEQAKERFLIALWLSGAHRVDRLQLGHHAVDAAKHEIEALTSSIGYREQHIASSEKYLAQNRVKSGARKGRPFSKEQRRRIAAEISAMTEYVSTSRARIARLQRLLRSDVPGLVRDYAGCVRAVAA